MKIALTGAHGVGKTTLARELAKRLDLPLITDRARKAAKFLGIDQANDLRAVLVQQLAEEMRNSEGFVSDRSVLDLFAYWVAYGLKYDQFHTDICRNAKYDLLVYVPVETPLTDDGFRDVDLEFQRLVDIIIKEAFDFYLHVRKRITVSGTLEERVQTVMDALPGRGR